VPRMPDEHEKLRCTDVHLSLGGSAANTAHWLARLGVPVAMLGAVGVDPLGDWCVEDLRRAGVDVTRVQRIPDAATGVATVFVNPASKRMVTSGGANARFDPDRLTDGLFGPDAHVHVATPLKPIVVPVLQAARRSGATTSCDLDEPPGRDLTGLLDICFMTRSCLERHCGSISLREAFGAPAMAGPTALVVTLGAEGAAAVTDRADWSVPVDPVDVVDRTGGGDAFDAAFLAAWSRGESWLAALDRGLGLARQVIGRLGSRADAALLRPGDRTAYGLDSRVADSRAGG